jgi:hypothetical protein
MEMLGLPLEERKKAYAGVDLSSLITKYNQAEKQGDLPTMLALLDIIKAAPKGKTPPMTTVKDDIMAQAMPQPMPQMQPQASVPGFEGAVTALENQQMPVSGMANGGPVMNVMRDGDAYDDQPGRDEYAHGGVVKMTAGGIPPYNIATASMDDLMRFAQFGDPKAVEELTKRQMSKFQYRPMSELNKPMPQGVTFQQAFPGGKTPPRGVPGATPLSPSPAVTPGAAAPPTSLMGRSLGLLKRAGPYGIAASIGIPIVGDALMSTDRGTASAEQDPLTAMQGTTGQQDRSGATPVPVVAPVAAPPGAGGTTPPPSAAGGAGTPGGPALTSDIFGMLKPKSLTESLAEQTAYRKGLEEKGEIPSYEQLKKEYEEFRTEGKTRAETDRAAAKEAFKENILLNAALAAPQFLKGSGLAQATARFGETFAPMALQTAAEKSKAIKQANVAERESQDKFRLAQIDLNKAKRAESLGNYDKARSLSLDSIKTYATAVLDKYKSDAYVTASTGAYDRMLVGKQYDLAEKSLNDLYITPAFKSASPEMKQEMIRVRVQSIFQIRPGIGGLQTNRLPIQNVPD